MVKTKKHNVKLKWYFILLVIFLEYWLVRPSINFLLSFRESGNVRFLKNDSINFSRTYYFTNLTVSSTLKKLGQLQPLLRWEKRAYRIISSVTGSTPIPARLILIIIYKNKRQFDKQGRYRTIVSKFHEFSRSIFGKNSRSTFSTKNLSRLNPI